MEEIIWWIKVTAGLLAGFLVALIYSMAKRQMKVLYCSLLLFVLSLGTGAYAVYLFATKSYHQVKEMTRSRTGEEIYAALLGPPQHACVQIVKYQDQIVPRIDVAIMVQCSTCPAELERIVGQVPYTSTVERNIPGLDGFTDQSWPALSGDSVRVFSFSSEDGRRLRYIYASPDSTQILYLDISD
jgi:hypothetical protein